MAAVLTVADAIAITNVAGVIATVSRGMAVKQKLALLS